MENKNLNNAKFHLEELIHDTNDPDLLRELKIILMDVNAIPDDIAQTIIKYEDYNDREDLLAQITKLNETIQQLNNKIDEKEVFNLELREDNGLLRQRISDLTEINALSKKLIKILENS